MAIDYDEHPMEREPTAFDCIVSVLERLDKSDIDSIAEIISNAIDVASKSAGKNEYPADAQMDFRHIASVLAEIYEFDASDPVANGWVGQDGRP